MNNTDLTPEQEAALEWACKTIWKFDPDDIELEQLAKEERRTIEDFAKLEIKYPTEEELEHLRQWAASKGYY